LTRSRNTSTPDVSVIVPAYKHERYIGQAIDSVLEQTLSEWELILIDDASPDNTWQAIQTYNDPRIRSVRHAKNLGAHETINEGIRLAKGQYLAILNSDDFFFPHRLETCITLMEERRLDLVGTDLVLITADGRPVNDSGHWWLTWHQGLKDLYRENGDLLATLFTGNIFITTSNFFFRRTLPRKIGDFRNLRYVHDYDFCFRAIADPDIAVDFVPSSPSLAYRLHGHNTILENRMAASRETFELLSGWYPRLVPPEQRHLASAFADHARRVEGYIEEEFNLMILGNVAHDERRSQACARQLVAERTERQQQREELLSRQQEIGNLRNACSTFSSLRLADADTLDQCLREAEQLRRALVIAENQNANAASPTQDTTAPLCFRLGSILDRVRKSFESALRRVSKKARISIQPHGSAKPFREEKAP
jgi:glycosyltransferase involved in cell wall biosynthesis